MVTTTSSAAIGSSIDISWPSVTIFGRLSACRRTVHDEFSSPNDRRSRALRARQDVSKSVILSITSLYSTVILSCSMCGPGAATAFPGFVAPGRPTNDSRILQTNSRGNPAGRWESAIAAPAFLPPAGTPDFGSSALPWPCAGVSISLINSMISSTFDKRNSQDLSDVAAIARFL